MVVGSLPSNIVTEALPTILVITGSIIFNTVVAIICPESSRRFIIANFISGESINSAVGISK